MAAGTSDDRRRTVAAAVLLAAFVLTLHAAVVIHTLPRRLDHDEGEYLRAAEWMASGKTIYRDFLENHPPFLHQILETFAPTRLDFHQIQDYIANARLLTALAGTLAVLCVAAFAARVAGTPFAALPAMAVLLLPGWTFDRSVAEVRPEAYTLLLFWGGALLITAAGRTALSGLGAGLVLGAAVWNPKWPLETIVILSWYATLLFMARKTWRAVVASLALAALPPALLVAIALRVTTPERLLFFGYRYPAACAQWFRSSPLVAATYQFDAFKFCSVAFQPIIAIPAIVLFVVACRVAWRHMTGRRRALVALAGALVVAAAIETRFVYPWPRLWPQYFSMWGCVLAVAYGVTATIVWRGQKAPLVAAAIAVALYTIVAVPRSREEIDESQQAVHASLMTRLQPGDAIWLMPHDSPFPVPAGSYYWYAFLDQVPFTLSWAETPEGRRWLPRVRDADLPPCRMLNAHLHGLAPGETYVRFIDDRISYNLPDSRRCTVALLRGGFARRLATTPFLEILPPQRR